MNKICVFCGSSLGNNLKYKEYAEILGIELCKNNIELIYGGGNAGIMGIVSSTVMNNNGKVIGIIPKKLYECVDHLEISDLYIVNTMHERKAKMYSMADGFIALPGGIGTLEEISEVFTWYQIGYHYKPTALLNIDGYYDSLIDFLNKMVSEGFLKQRQLNALIIDNDIKSLIEKMKHHKPVKMSKWIK